MNLLTDVLSRKPEFNSCWQEIIHTIFPLSQLPSSFPAAQVTTRGQAGCWDDPRGDQMMTALRSALPADPWFSDNRDALTLKDGLAWKGSKLYIHASLRLQVLQRSHNSRLAGQFGFLKSLHLARRQFWWPKMKADVEDYVKSCTTMKKTLGKPLGSSSKWQTHTSPERKLPLTL